MTKEFKQWLSNYSESQHHLKGWRDSDQYLDEVELPKILYLSLVQKWLREEQKIDIDISVVFNHEHEMPERLYYHHIIYLNKNGSVSSKSHYNNGLRFPTYEDALEAALQETLKLI